MRDAILILDYEKIAWLSLALVFAATAPLHWKSVQLQQLVGDIFDGSDYDLYFRLGI